MYSLTFATCGRQTSIQPCTFRGKKFWRITAPNLPTRWVTLHGDKSRALHAVVNAYGYVDGNKCVNYASAQDLKQKIPPIEIQHDPTLSRLSDLQIRTLGIPQREQASGLCWYCALCFVMFFSAPLRDFLKKYMPMQTLRLCEYILQRPQTSETFRKHLYDRYAFGDRPGQDPALDGQNGFGQFCILAARFDIPLTRLFAPKLFELTDPVRDQRGVEHTLRRRPRDPQEPSLLTVRAFRCKWTPQRRLIFEGRRYKLVAMLIGSEYCGHQIGISSINGDINAWALSDSDMSFKGIGPCMWSIRRTKGETASDFKQRWHRMWETIVPVTLFGNNQKCDLNPINRPPHELEKYARLDDSTSPSPGVVNTDYIYLHVQ